MALIIHLSIYCAVAAFFGALLYYLMRPTWLPNPGMTAHKASPITPNYVEVLR